MSMDFFEMTKAHPLSEVASEIDQLKFAAEINAETVREQQREIARLQGLLAAAGIEYDNEG